MVATFLFLRVPAPMRVPLPPGDDEEDDDADNDDEEEDAAAACMGALRRAKMSFLSNNFTFLTDRRAAPDARHICQFSNDTGGELRELRLFLADPPRLASVNVCACTSPRL